MSWFCLRCTVAGEFRALEALRARAFLAYLPLATRILTRHGQRQERRTPLLSRYLFVKLVDFKRMDAIHEISAVQEILPHAHEPQPVPSHEIECLQQREEAGEFTFKQTAYDRRRERRILRSFSELAHVNITGYLGCN